VSFVHTQLCREVQSSSLKIKIILEIFQFCVIHICMRRPALWSDLHRLRMSKGYLPSPLPSFSRPRSLMMRLQSCLMFLKPRVQFILHHQTVFDLDHRSGKTGAFHWVVGFTFRVWTSLSL
jgi:hypothetical protein